MKVYGVGACGSRPIGKGREMPRLMVELCREPGATGEANSYAGESTFWGGLGLHGELELTSTLGRKTCAQRLPHTQRGLRYRIGLHSSRHRY